MRHSKINPFPWREGCRHPCLLLCRSKTFGDEATAAKVLQAQHPKEQKALGRAVTPYDDAIWQARRLNVVYVACREKFTQHPHLLEQLLATQGTTLVEASPYDRVWGIGMAENAPGVDDPANWRGQNLLGKVLTKLRDDLMFTMQQSPRRRF